MTYAGDSSIDARVQAVDQDYRRRMSRLFVVFASIEGPVLVLLIVLIFGVGIVDAETGTWIILGAAVVSGGILSMLLLRHVRSRAQAVAQARGENPLF